MLVRIGLVLFVAIFCGVLNLGVYGKITVTVKYVRICDPNSSNGYNINLTFKTVGDKQFIDGSITLANPIDNSGKINVSLETLVGTKFVYLFSINERKPCESMHKYFGEFAYDLERNAQLIPRACPIAKGTYRLHNAPIDFQRMTTLGNFPHGHLRFTVNLYDSKGNFLACVLSESIIQ